MVNCFQLCAGVVPAGLSPARLLLHRPLLPQRTERFPADVEAFNHLSERFLRSDSQQRANTLMQPVPIPVMTVCSGKRKRNVWSAAEYLAQMLTQQWPCAVCKPGAALTPLRALHSPSFSKQPNEFNLFILAPK